MTDAGSTTAEAVPFDPPIQPADSAVLSDKDCAAWIRWIEGLANKLKDPNVERLTTLENFREFINEKLVLQTNAALKVGRLHTLNSLLDVEEETISWLWEPYIAQGKFHLMEGDPGAGKSFLTTAISGAITAGHWLPGMVKGATVPIGKVLLCADEDGWADTIVPRHRRIGADLALIRPVLGLLKVKGTQLEEDMLHLDAEGVAALEAEIAEYKPTLVILDPLVSYFPSEKDSYKASEVRSVIRPLGQIAGKHGCAIVGVRHLNKGFGRNLLYSGQGSIDFMALARSALRVGMSPRDDKVHYMIQPKNSMAEKGPPRGFVINCGEFEWCDTLNLTNDDIISVLEGNEALTAFDEAKLLLETLLDPDPMKAEDIFKIAKKDEIGHNSIRKAAKALNVKQRRVGGRDGYSEWRLPSDQEKDMQPIPLFPNGAPTVSPGEGEF